MEAKVRTLAGRVPELRGKEVTIEVLAGGLTNHNYCLECDGQRFVLRMGGKNSTLLGIDRHVEHSCAQAAFQAGIAPEVVVFFPECEAMVTRYLPGRTLTPKDLRSPAMLRRVVASLRTYHETPGGAGKFSAFETVRRYYASAKKHGVSFPLRIVDALGASAQIEQAVGAPDRLCNCHNDLLPTNFVYHKRAIWILDWEYSGVGDLFFDLGNLAANGLFTQERETKLLQFYFGRATTSALQRLRLMRLASDLREAMWGFLQMGISKLDFDYQAYAHRHLDRFLRGANRLFRGPKIGWRLFEKSPGRGTRLANL